MYKIEKKKLPSSFLLDLFAIFCQKTAGGWSRLFVLYLSIYVCLPLSTLNIDGRRRRTKDEKESKQASTCALLLVVVWLVWPHSLWSSEIENENFMQKE